LVSYGCSADHIAFKWFYVGRIPLSPDAFLIAAAMTNHKLAISALLKMMPDVSPAVGVLF